MVATTTKKWDEGVDAVGLGVHDSHESEATDQVQLPYF